MQDVDFVELTRYAKQFSQLTESREAALKNAEEKIKPHIGQVTDEFYAVLLTIDNAKPYLEGVLESLKKAHFNWLNSLFDGNYNEDYTKGMYHVGDVHVKVNLPVEFMAGSMSLISGEFMKLTAEVYADDPKTQLEVNGAINAILGFSLMVMQESYQASSLASELDKFLKISGISRVLFNNMAKAYSI